MITIIIPIYNNAAVLERCLKSAQEQTYRNIEVLMINDGSQDNSEEICKRFEEKDKRFRYIYQDNGGVSVARNTGLCNMRGDFFTFVDSDDWIEPEYCEKLINEAESSDSDVVFSGINYWSNGVKSPQQESAFADIVENRRVEHFLIGHKEYAIGSSCRVLFRRDKYNDIRFDVHFHIYEDLIFLLTALSMTNKMSYVSDCLYNYDLSQVNYFKKYNRDNFFDICYNIGNKIYELLMRFGYDDWAKAELFKEYCLAVDWLYVTAEDRSQMFKKLKSHVLAKEFCTKENYHNYKRLYTHKDLKAKAKAMLLYKKHFRAFLLYRGVRGKIHKDNNG